MAEETGWIQFFRMDDFHGAWAGSLGDFKEVARAMAHGVSQGAIADVQGGRFSSGFYAGAFSSLAASYGPMNGSEHFTPKLVQAAVAGGTGSVIGGDKFENGAVTGAFVFLFNDAMSPDENPIRDNFNTQDEAAIAACQESLALSIKSKMEYEYGGEIYRYDRNGQTFYGYVEPRQGQGHKVIKDGIEADLGPKFRKTVNSVDGAVVAAHYHSHTNNESFSNHTSIPRIVGGDVSVMKETRKPLYLIRQSGTQIIIEMGVYLKGFFGQDSYNKTEISKTRR